MTRTEARRLARHYVAALRDAVRVAIATGKDVAVASPPEAATSDEEG